VVILGLDGSGKTTVCQTIVKRGWLRGSVYFWGRYESLVVRAIGKLLGLTEGNPPTPTFSPEAAAKKRRLSGMPVVQGLFLMWMASTYIVKLNLAILHRRLKSHGTILADRFYHDTLVDLEVDFMITKERRRTITKVFGALVPKPDVLLLLDVSPEEALQRKIDIPSKEYAERRRQAYLGLAHEFGIQTIDSNRRLDDVVHDVVHAMVEGTR